MADRTSLVAEAFIYGFPLVFDLEQVDRFQRKGLGSLAAAEFNRFSHAQQLAGPQDTFVSINNDTVYSIAQIDLSGGPVRLEVPASGDRYYVLQFVDAWSNNFAYVGQRATGNGAGTYLLVPPGSEESHGGDATVIRFPTAVGTIVGRWAVDGEDDLPAVAELQAGLSLAAKNDAGGQGIPEPNDRVGDDLAFLEKLRVWMRAFPPAAHDRELQQKFASIGLLDDESPYADPDPDLATELRQGLAAGKERLEEVIKGGGSDEVNGWRLTYHVFDYNVDFFEVGTLDAPEWKLEDPAVRYAERAGAARAGLWGNHAYEAAYVMAWVDGDGEQLNGAHRYEIRFATPPPAEAFWSMTMYDMPEYFLVDNPIDRYSIGDRTPGLRYNDDGSLTCTIQHEPPEDPVALANWLPAPEGDFRPILRMYRPGDAVLNGSYELPPITRTDR